MRRVFPPSDYCDKGQYRGEKLARARRIVVALFVLLMPAMPLRAQSELNSSSGLYEFNSNGDFIHSNDPEAVDLKFNSDSGQILAEGNGVNLDANTPIESSPLRSSIIFEKDCGDPAKCTAAFRPAQPIFTPETPQAAQDTKPDTPDSASKTSSELAARPHKRPDCNLDIYYRNRREFSLDVGWHPINIPFIYDFAAGGGYNMTPLKYTLVPIVASLRWHITNVGWRGFFRGNMDFTFSGSITAIPRGPETHYVSFDFGIRRNFVYRNWKVVPFFEQRGGAGIINAKEPLGVLWAQGQNLTFTYNLGAGARYNINSKYSFSAGMNYMHISNAYLSQPQFNNYGINVYGPMFGLDVRLGKAHHASQ
jgi:hypothetical protein